MAFGDIIVGWLLLAYFLVWLLTGLDARVPVCVGVGFIAVSAGLLVGGFPGLADRVAVYAYYFLVAGVVLMTVRYAVKSDEGLFRLVSRRFKV